MDSFPTLSLIGLSHRTAPLEVRERYAVQAADTRVLLRELAASPGIAEACLLSTCNRTEALIVADGNTDPSAVVRALLFRNLESDALYTFRGVHAVMHLFRVASGLDSAVLGESEILGQLKRAQAEARAAGTAGRDLSALLPQALRVGKRVRSETEIGQGTLSVARAGVDLAQRVFGDLERCRVLIVGAGETGQLVARHLAGIGVRSLAFASRTREHAESAAAEFHGAAHGLDELRALLHETDLCVTCVEGAPGLVSAEHFDPRHLALRDRPMLLIDLSVPRAIAAGLEDVDGLFVYDLDALQPVIEKNLGARGEALEHASTILVAEVHKCLALRTYASFSPAIAELRRRFEDQRERTLDAIAGSAQGAADARAVELAHDLTRRLLDIALDQMKDGARRARSEEALDREYQRFLENL